MRVSTDYRSRVMGVLVFSITFTWCVLFSHQATANPTYSMNDFESFPINIVDNTTQPKVMINTSNDHQLFYKAYNDYSDIDGDGTKETTYSHSIDYYGYFDSYKCYKYDTGDERFEPFEVTDDKYCPTGQNLWSGNFLNWATMARIDAIRKMFFGGHRRVDTSTKTVLERTYLPHDAHSWAKYYDGADIPKLTPFTVGSDYNCDQGDLTKSDCMTGGSLDLKKVGITLGNTTDIDRGAYKSKEYSDVVTEPPLMKAVKGNYSLWASNERWQVTWKSGSPVENQSASNGNDPTKSGIYSYASSPAWSERIGQGNYVVRVVACDDGTDGNGKSLLGQEKCKLYPGPDGDSGTADDNYKPIGLLQKYADNKEMQFGMVAGSYDKHASGGVIIRAMGDIQDEINVTTDGTFPMVAKFAGGPEDNNKASGLINAWSLFRIVGYDGHSGKGLYNDSDNCPWGLSKFADVTKSNACRNWGNPFSEIYYQSIHYLADGGVIGDYRSNSSTDIPGLPVPQSLATDPIDSTEYCAQLSVINLNSSVASYDADELDGTSYSPSKVWDPNDLPGDKSTSAMTDYVGASQGLHTKKFFLGETDTTATTDNDYQLCTGKELNHFGDALGLCPEGPRLSGSYRIAGLAYYAHTKDIRPDSDNSRKLEGTQTVDTYSVALASSIPALEIPDPTDTSKNIATIIPACRNQRFDPQGNCAIVDYKLVSQTSTTGEIFVVWEDSEQGGDYDQDMWGTLQYTLDSATNPTKITVTTNVISKSTPYEMGFAYVIGGTKNDDGFHAHSGINGYTNTETADSGDDCSDGNGCAHTDGTSTKTYELGTSDTDLLKDPLWYAAKWGGFEDSNGNNLPDLTSEWDAKNNSTWTDGSDGIPDNFFYAANPQKLEQAMDRVFSAILERSSSGTAAAVVSSNVRGEGALYQAYYEPLKKDVDGDEARWLGTVQALWLDSYGYTRQDCSPPTDLTVYDPANDDTCPTTPLTCGAPNGQLDDYCVDNAVETYYDDILGKTRVKIFRSSDPDEFTPYSMQGIVKTYDSSGGTGGLVLEPNSMEGVVTYDGTGHQLTIDPYSITGTITAYDATTGVVTLDVTAGSWTGVDGEAYTDWQATISTGGGTYFSEDTITMEVNGALNIYLSPLDASLGDNIGTATVTLTSKNIVGKSGEAFSNWIVECSEGSTADGEANGVGLTLTNNTSGPFLLAVENGDFSTCTKGKVKTYDLQGTEGNSYADWTVANLDTIIGTGTSSSTLTLANSGDLTLTVSPTDNWLVPGQRVLVSNYSFTTSDIYDINYLWNGREELSVLSEIGLDINRLFTDSAGTGRYITTWFDDDLDGVVDVGEYKAFQASDVDSVNYNFFDVATTTEAEELIDYVRGIEKTGSRNRTIKYDGVTATVQRLGDIINSTPTVVAAPQEGFDLLYEDTSFATFRRQYQDRRVMVYVGGNDGLLHAFNAGFYNVTTINNKQTVEYSVNGTDWTGAAATAHPLGSEIWAYAPKNLLSHLKWLEDRDYAQSHVYFIDKKPRVFDANIFATTDTDHPDGWGTVMVVGMNLGGGRMEVDADTDQDGDVDGADSDAVLQSAYLVFDITNPEKAPVLLGEIPMPDDSFTTVYPSVVAFRDVLNTSCNSGTVACNDWYLMFGTGPDNGPTLANVSDGITKFESSQTAKVYLFNLSQLTTASGALPDASSTTVPTGCTVDALASTGYNVLKCDTNKSNSFVGTPSVVDWNLDFFGDTSYFGLVGDSTSTSGEVFRFAFNGDADPASWDSPSVFFQSSAPVVGQPAPSIDDKDNKWIYFGTGRYYASGDKTSTPRQRLYGVKEDDTGVTRSLTDLIDTTNIEVYSDGSLGATYHDTLLTDNTTGIDTFDDLEDEIDSNTNIFGWKLDLPILSGTFGTSASTRNTTRSALLGGVLFSSVFQPSGDPCAGEGLSRLYGLYYKTGTAFPDPSVFGSTITTKNGKVAYKSNSYIDLGVGIATAPSLHSGSGTGSDSVKVFTQLSTGDIVQATADTVLPVRTGKTAWTDR